MPLWPLSVLETPHPATTRSNRYILDPAHDPIPIRALLELGDNAADRELHVWDSGALPDTSHTVTIEWTGTKGVPSGGGDINVDAFEVLGSLD